jgi:hypothetical protein
MAGASAALIALLGYGGERGAALFEFGLVDGVAGDAEQFAVDAGPAAIRRRARAATAPSPTDLLRDLLGAEVIATGPNESPLPVTGPCSRCGSSTTVYGPAGSSLCDICRIRLGA